MELHPIILCNLAIGVFTLFRFVVYCIPFGLAHATEVKLTKEAWANRDVRELAFCWTRAIRLMNGVRLMFLLVVVVGGHIETNRLHLLTSTVFDGWMMMRMLGGVWNQGKMVQHRAPWVPTRIQMGLFCTEAILLYIYGM
jgi:hypothetical protein